MAKKKCKRLRIDSFNFLEHKTLADKYEVVELLGRGWEGEVYKLKELSTGIERAGKFFYPQRNVNNRALKFYARKLHRLRDCEIVIQYHTQETIDYHGHSISFLVSEYVDGEILSNFLNRRRGKRIGAFQGLHLLYALATGIDSIHQLNEYHGDLHTDNIILRRHGLGFDLKILDMYSWGFAKKENIQNDVIDMIRIFYDAIGGPKAYPKHAPEVKAICCGLKRSLILSKFKTASKLRSYLENMEWEHTDR